MTNEKNFVKVS